MPYKSKKNVPASFKKLDGAPLTVAQANKIAEIADSLTDVDNPWAVAIATFKKAYRNKGGKWIKREKSIEDLYEILKHLAGRHNQKRHGSRYGSMGAVKRSLQALQGDKQALQSYRKTARTKAAKAKESPVTATYSAVGPGDRLHANVADLAADYKARGIDRQAAYGQLVKDKNFNPGMDNKEFQKVWDSVESKPLVSSASVTGPVMELEETYGTPKRKVVIVSEDEHSVQWIDENGTKGGTPRAGIKTLTPVTEKTDKSDIKTNEGRNVKRADGKNILPPEDTERLDNARYIAVQSGSAPQVLSAGLNPKEETRRLGLPDDFYQTVQTGDMTVFGSYTKIHSNVPNDKYLTPEYTKAKDKYDAALKRGDDRKVLDRYRKDMNAEWDKAVANTRANLINDLEAKGGGKFEPPKATTVKNMVLGEGELPIKRTPEVDKQAQQAFVQLGTRREQLLRQREELQKTKPSGWQEKHARLGKEADDVNEGLQALKKYADPYATRAESTVPPKGISKVAEAVQAKPKPGTTSMTPQAKAINDIKALGLDDLKEESRAIFDKAYNAGVPIDRAKYDKVKAKYEEQKQKAKAILRDLAEQEGSSNPDLIASTSLTNLVSGYGKVNDKLDSYLAQTGQAKPKPGIAPKKDLKAEIKAQGKINERVNRVHELESELRTYVYKPAAKKAKLAEIAKLESEITDLEKVRNIAQGREQAQPKPKYDERDITDPRIAETVQATRENRRVRVTPTTSKLSEAQLATKRSRAKRLRAEINETGILKPTESQLAAKKAELARLTDEIDKLS